MVGTSHLDTLTDTIFGFALAVGALSLTGRSIQNESEVIMGIFMFGQSFLILIVIWWGHHGLMLHIDTNKSRTIFLNIVLLFFVAIEPYLLNTLNVADSAMFSFTSTLYAVDMTFLMGISAGLTHILVAENRGKLSDAQLKSYRLSRNAQIVFGGLFLLSALPQFATWRFLNMPVRVFLWYTTLALSIFTSAKNRRNRD